jgi:hypothetical protein
MELEALTRLPEPQRAGSGPAKQPGPIVIDQSQDVVLVGKRAAEGAEQDDLRGIAEPDLAGVGRGEAFEPPAFGPELGDCAVLELVHRSAHRDARHVHERRQLPDRRVDIDEGSEHALPAL